MERSGATSASTTRGGRREDSVPDERAKPKWHFIRFLPPLADIKLNLFQFDLSRVTTARDTFSVIRWFYEEEDLSIVRSKFNFKKLILVKNGKILSLGEIYTHIWEYFVEICAIFVRLSFFWKRSFFPKSIRSMVSIARLKMAKSISDSQATLRKWRRDRSCICSPISCRTVDSRGDSMAGLI